MYAPFDRRGQPADAPGCSHRPDCPGGTLCPAGELQAVGFAALGYFTAGFPEQLQQLVQVSRLLCKGVVNSSTEQFPMGGLRLISQPLVVTFPVGLWVLDNGQVVFNAEGIP